MRWTRAKIGISLLTAVLSWSVPLHADTIVPGYIMASSTLVEPGYDHSAWQVPDYSGELPHVSLVLPENDQEWGDPFLNPAGLGADGREAGETEGYTQDPDAADVFRFDGLYVS